MSKITKQNKQELKEQIKRLEEERTALADELKTLKNQLGRRRYPRREISIRINCKVGKDSFVCCSRDISEGGTFLETDRGLAIGTEISLNIEVIPGHIINLKGCIVWTGSDGVGVKFNGSKQSLNKLKMMLYAISELRTILYTT